VLSPVFAKQNSEISSAYVQPPSLLIEEVKFGSVLLRGQQHVGVGLIAAIRLALFVQFFLHQFQLLKSVKAFVVLVCFDLDVFALIDSHVFVMLL